MPDSIERPELMLEAAPIFDAWFELSTERSSGLSLGDIPFSALDRYADRYGFDDPDEFDLFRRGIRAMEDQFRTWRTETKSIDAPS